MRKRLTLIPAGAIAALALMATDALAGGGTSRAGIASARCSRAAAQSALREHPKFDPIYIPKLEFPGQVLCGAFLGSGSRTMVVGFAAAVCINDSYDLGWGVYRLRAGRWQPAWKHWEGSQSLAAVGSTIKETTGIRRPTDSGCNDTGGTRSRIWHWNGSRFVAGPWTTHEAPIAVQSNPSVFYARPAGGFITCGIASEAEEQVRCLGVPAGTNPLENVVTLQSSGQVETCTRHQTEVRCFEGNPGENTPTLSAGAVDTLGRFTCKVLETGVECTVAATGKGFLITPGSVTEVGG